MANTNLDSNQSSQRHIISFQICTNDAEIVRAIVTLDNTNEIVEIAAFHGDEKPAELTESDLTLIRLYTQGMLQKVPM
jgi:hypothetical protein